MPTLSDMKPEENDSMEHEIEDDDVHQIKEKKKKTGKKITSTGKKEARKHEEKLFLCLVCGRKMARKSAVDTHEALPEGHKNCVESCPGLYISGYKRVKQFDSEREMEIFYKTHDLDLGAYKAKVDALREPEDKNDEEKS